jgi:hypothetical protein
MNFNILAPKNEAMTNDFHWIPIIQRHHLPKQSCIRGTFWKITVRPLVAQTRIWESMCNLKSSVFWAITPCSPVKVNQTFGATYRIHFQGWTEVRRQYEADNKQSSSSSETSVDFHRTTLCHIPQDRILDNHRCENLRSYTCAMSLHQEGQEGPSSFFHI